MHLQACSERQKRKRATGGERRPAGVEGDRHVMTANPPTATAAKAVRDWRRLLQPYRSPRLARSVFELAVTLVPFVLLWSAAFLALEVGYWLTLLLVVPAAMFLVRLFL